MDSWEKFDEQVLPHSEAFYNDLTSEPIKEEDYSHAKAVWDHFRIDSLGSYHNFYVRLDTLLLADIFQNFRELCLSFYKLDPCHMFTAAGLAWRSCLKMTKVNMELITDPNMYLFFERGIRGGICMITKRFSQANNKYLKNYSKEEASKYIMYYDANNLYGWAMIQHLPISKFRWLTEDEISKIDVCNIPDDSDEGYVFSVDMEVPSELHDVMSDYPLAAQNLQIKHDMLSEYTKDLADQYNRKVSPVIKLTPNLYEKKKTMLFIIEI